MDSQPVNEPDTQKQTDRQTDRHTSIKDVLHLPRLPVEEVDQLVATWLEDLARLKADCQPGAGGSRGHGEAERCTRQGNTGVRVGGDALLLRE